METKVDNWMKPLAGFVLKLLTEYWQAKCLWIISSPAMALCSRLCTKLVSYCYILRDFLLQATWIVSTSIGYYEQQEKCSCVRVVPISKITFFECSIHYAVLFLFLVSKGKNDAGFFLCAVQMSGRREIKTPLGNATVWFRKYGSLGRYLVTCESPTCINHRA